VSGVEGADHLQEKLGKLLGHSHLREDSAKLIVGQLDILKVRLADRLADRRGDFGISQVPVSMQLAGLFAGGGMQEGVGNGGADVAGRDHRKFQIRTERRGDYAHLADCASLGKRVLHEISGAQVEHVGRTDRIKLLFEIVKAEHGPGSGGFIGSDAAECDDILDRRVLDRGRNGVTDAVRIAQRIIAGWVGWNHDVGRVCLAEGLGEGFRVGDIGDECLGALGCENL